MMPARCPARIQYFSPAPSLTLNDLLSPPSSADYVNGTVLTVDGGYLVR